MGRWRLIATAPKGDEEHVLLFIPSKGAIEGWWFSSPKGGDDGWETVIGFIGEPSHWMPLPEPPTEKAPPTL